MSVVVLDLKTIFTTENSKLAVQTEFDLSSEEFGGVCPLSKPVVVTGGVENRAGVVYLNLVCQVWYQANCDRCGTFCGKSYNVPIERVLVTEQESEENDLLLLVPSMQLDLFELCYGEIVLSVPTKYLCKEDCKGICQTCGANLNTEPCGCSNQTVDPRLAALQALLED